MTHPILIAGAGIGGLATALTLHQIGIPCRVIEQSRQIRPLGVGINLQPNAVRELIDMELGTQALDQIGIRTREWALVGLNGRDIYAEPRGQDAGYHWPQYALHRGRLQMLLYQAVLDRLGAQAITTGQAVAGYAQTEGGVRVTLTSGDVVDSPLLIGADGIHSRVRAQMHPGQPPLHWGGAMMWRGVSRARPLRGGAAFVGLGTLRQRMVIYPLSVPDADGLAEINWIAEVTQDTTHGAQRDSWFTPVPTDGFAPHFADWRWEWLDVPALIAGAPQAFENPMIDRDPLPTWVQGRVGLLGDAAHPMMPTGSNGASQAIVDARVLGACLRDHGVGPRALAAYDARLCEPIGQVQLRNRQAGPFGLLGLVDDRCGGVFDDIDAVVPADERLAFVKGYQQAAGYARDQLNAAPSLLGSV